MRVSVIIPTYNRAALMREALDSVFAQTYENLEVIVIDDGSADNTASVVAEYGDLIKSIRIGRSGISVARNRGIDVATGDYIAFLDSDDLWLPEKIAKHLNFAAAHAEMPLTYTDAIQFSENGPDIKSFVENFPDLNDPNCLFRTMIKKFSIPLTSTVMIKTSFLKETGLRFPSEIEIGEDLGLFLQILAMGGRFGYYPEKLTMRRMHASNISGNHCRRFEQRKLLYTNLLRQPSNRYNRDQKLTLKFGLRDAIYRVAECDWENCNFSKARRGFFQTIGMDTRGVRALAYGILTLLPPSLIASMRKIKNSP